MSTRSSIAVQHSDGSISAVYCHFDGYLKGVGNELVLNHDSLNAAEELVSLGNLSSICKKVQAYARDHGAKFEHEAPMKYHDFNHYLRYVHSDIGDNGYRYIFKDGDWYVWGKIETLTKVEAALNSPEFSY